ncbi:MAG: hypothetical protein N2C14_15595, partial [Planctomycetales bacterium]
TGEQLWENYQKVAGQVAEEIVSDNVEGPPGGKDRTLRRVLEASAWDWRAGAWLLERRWWRDFGRRPAESVSPRELAAVLERAVDLLLVEVPDEFHERIRLRLGELTDLPGEQPPDEPLPGGQQDDPSEDLESEEFDELEESVETV